MRVYFSLKVQQFHNKMSTYKMAVDKVNDSVKMTSWHSTAWWQHCEQQVGRERTHQSTKIISVLIFSVNYK